MDAIKINKPETLYANPKQVKCDENHNRRTNVGLTHSFFTVRWQDNTIATRYPEDEFQVNNNYKIYNGRVDHTHTHT